MSEHDLDPGFAITEVVVEDPTPQPVTDPGHPDYVEPFAEATRPVGL